MATASILKPKEVTPIRIAYEHPLIVRIAHWLNAAAVLVLIASGSASSWRFPALDRKSRSRTSSSCHRKGSRSAVGWAEHCSGTSPSCGFSLAVVCSM